MQQILLLILIMGMLATTAQAQSCDEALAYVLNPLQGEIAPRWTAQTLCSGDAGNVPLSNLLSENNIGYFQVSPVNPAIAYANGTLYVLDAAELTPRPVLAENETTFYHDPVWSPDGTQLVAVETDEEGNGDWLVLTDLNGNQRRLTEFISSTERHFIIVPIAWSPDGAWISYSLSRQVDEENWDANILLLDTACIDDSSQPCTTQPLEIIDNSGERLSLTLPNGSTMPEHWWGAAWSPDGGQLAFVCGTNLCFLNADGTDFRRSTVEFQGHSLAWSPSGQYLAYTSDGDIHVYDMEQDAHSNITQTPDVQEFLPTWLSMPEAAFLFAE